MSQAIVPSRPGRRRLSLWLATVGLVIAWLNILHPTLRLSVGTLNLVVGTALFLTPWLLLMWCLRAESGWRRWVLGALLTVFGIVGLLPATCAGMESVIATFEGRHDFELLYRTRVGGRNLGVYRTNCGATCSFGIDVRQELQLFPGILLVHPEWGWYPADTAQVTLGPRPSTARVVLPPYGERRPNPVDTV